MGLLQKLGQGPAVLALVALLAPQAVWATDAGLGAPGPSVVAARQDVVRDVALGQGGVLVGQVVTEQGAPVAGVEVKVLVGGEAIAMATTDEEGRFLVRGLRGGNYQIESAQAGGVYRLWTTEAAPPSAQGGALLVTNSGTVRGQMFHHDGRYGPAIRGAIVGGLIVGGVWIAVESGSRS